MKLLVSVLALLAAATFTGCRSHMLTIRLANTSAAPISTIIVDYPTATFGKNKLAPGETFSSAVKITDQGPIKVQFTDANGRNHNYTGPVLKPNAEGAMEIKLDQNNATVVPEPRDR